MRKTTVTRSGKSLLVVSLVILTLGAGLVAWQMLRGEPNRPQPLRGGAVQLDRAGPHSIYVYRGASQRMDAAAEQAWADARSANFVVQNDQTGEQLDVKNVYETTEMQNNLMGRLVEFEAPTPGKYTIQIEPPLDVIHPSVRPSAPLAELQGEVVGVLIGLAAWGLGVLAIFVGAVLLIIALVRKKPANKQVVES